MSKGWKSVLVLPPSAGQLGQVIENGDDATCPPRERDTKVKGISSGGLSRVGPMSETGGQLQTLWGPLGAQHTGSCVWSAHQVWGASGPQFHKPEWKSSGTSAVQLLWGDRAPSGLLPA